LKKTDPGSAEKLFPAASPIISILEEFLIKEVCPHLDILDFFLQWFKR
jgi:hypothetical protein